METASGLTCSQGETRDNARDICAPGTAKGTANDRQHQENVGSLRTTCLWDVSGLCNKPCGASRRCNCCAQSRRTFQNRCYVCCWSYRMLLDRCGSRQLSEPQNAPASGQLRPHDNPRSLQEPLLEPQNTTGRSIETDRRPKKQISQPVNHNRGPKNT